MSNDFKMETHQNYRLNHREIIEKCLLLAGDSIANEKQLISQLRTLRNSCARGAQNQIEIVKHEQFVKCLEQWLFATMPSDLQTLCWQLLANTIVNNEETQQLVWQSYGEYIIEFCTVPPLGTRTNIQLMIVQNIMNGGGIRSITQLEVLRMTVRIWKAVIDEQCKMEFEYLHFLFEQFLVNNGRSTVCSYSAMSAEERLTFLDYLGHYLSQDSPNGLVHDFLLRHISKDFQMKSDYILRQMPQTDVQKRLHPREAYALLRVIATASGSDKYTAVYTANHALFLNVSSLLRCLVAVGKETLTPTTFTPLSKLEDVAPSSHIGHDFEKEVSFELKTLLVRATANLLYKNPTNQNYCHDTQLMPVLFDCTTMDARNPLMKEWSIMAIRNACIGCTDNQNTIRNLSKQGSATNDILTELNLEMGSLRIQPHAE